MSPEQAASEYWSRRAGRLRRRVNLGAWLSGWSPLLLAASFVGGVALIACRRMGIDAGRVWPALLAALAAGALVAFLRARRAFFSRADALVRLDAVLRLHNRLSAAAAGVGPWPAVPPRADHGLRWNGSRALGPLLFSGSFLAVAASVPVAARTPADPVPTEAPVAWSEMESWLAGLMERSLVEDEALRTWDRRLDELRRRPAREWYSHSSLEAGDSLRQELAGSLRSLGRDLSRADETLGRMEAVPKAARDEDLETLGRDLDSAASRLQTGALPLDKELLAQLETSVPLRTLSAEELAKLRMVRGRLQQGEGFCRGALRECREDDEECLLVAAAGAGRGGVDRGPGTLPLTLDPERSELAGRRLESVSNRDLSRALPGELIATDRSRHRVDRGAFRGPVAGGAITSVGSGGEAVWRNPTTPAEQKVLERYFK